MKPPRSRRHWLSAYQQMLLIRRFEEAVETLFRQGRIRGTAHPAIGQEAIAVGTCMALASCDYITSTHRGHGHFIARGGDPARIMAELFGKATGYSGGRGGSQIMADWSLGFLGSNGITGAGLPVATGTGLSLKVRKANGVAVCFFGDGAASQGMFHESLNLAALWRLPVIYLCENNQYAMSTPVNATIAGGSIVARATGYGIPGVTVDGNDLIAVYEAVQKARQHVLKQGPILLECLTYRLSGHSRGDSCNYRSPGETEKWKARDPLPRFKAWLVKQGILTGPEARRIQSTVRTIIRDAVRFARSSPDPQPFRQSEGIPT